MKQKKIKWAYNTKEERFVDRYIKQFLIKAQANLINDDTAEVKFEIFSLIEGKYPLNSNPKIITNLGEQGFIGLDGERLLTIVAERL